MTLRTGLLLVGALAAGGCATKAMRAQAGALAAAGERLEAETAAFSAARTAVVQLRQSSLIQRKREVAEQGQYNARTLAQWQVAGNEDRARRLTLFQGIVAASEAMYEVRDQGLLWEESVLHTRTALAIDTAALHRFVRDLVSLSRPGRFVDNVRFYVEYADQVGAQIDEGLADVKAALAAAKESTGPSLVTPIGAGAGAGAGGTRPDPDPPPTPKPSPDANPRPQSDPPPAEPTPGPAGPSSLAPASGPREPVVPATPKP